MLSTAPQTALIYNEQNEAIGTSAEHAINKWNEGLFPTDIGIHKDLTIFDLPEIRMDNGYGNKIPINMTVSLHVERQLFFGQLPVPHISGFKDELSDAIISNAFTVGIFNSN